MDDYREKAFLNKGENPLYVRAVVDATTTCGGKETIYGELAINNVEDSGEMIDWRFYDEDSLADLIALRDIIDKMIAKADEIISSEE